MKYIIRKVKIGLSDFLDCDNEGSVRNDSDFEPYGTPLASLMDAMLIK